MSENERLKKTILWLISQGIVDSQEELSKSIGYNPSSISQIVTGKKPISNKFLKKLGEFSEKINTEWIQFGKGSMLKDVEVSGSHNMVGSSGVMNNIGLTGKEKIIGEKGDVHIEPFQPQDAAEIMAEIERLRRENAELKNTVSDLTGENRALKETNDRLFKMLENK